MLNTGQLLFDASGRIRATNAAPDQSDNGTPTNTGRLAFDTGAPVTFMHGVGYAANGALCMSEIDPTYFDQGMPHITNRVSYDGVGAIDHYNYGLPFTANGALAVTVE